MKRSSWVRQRYLIVPSVERCSRSFRSGTSEHRSSSERRSSFERSVISAKEVAPFWWIQRKICPARYGFSPSSAVSQAVSSGRVSAHRSFGIRLLLVLPLVLLDLGLPEEVRDLGPRVVRRVGPVDGVLLHVGGEVL